MRRAALPFLLAASLARAQDVAPVDPKPAGVQPAKAFEVGLGYTRDYTPGGKNRLFYRLTYQGNKLLQNGQEPTLASVGSTYLKDPTEVDDFDLRFLLTDGVGRLDGPLANAVGLRPFDLKGDFFRFFRGKVDVSTKLLSDQQVNAGVGLESINVLSLVPALRDLRIPGVGDPSKVLRIGVLGEKQSRERGAAGTKETDTLQFTYRAYSALGFDYHRTRDASDLRNLLLGRIDRYTADDAKELAARLEETDPARVQGYERDPIYVTALFLVSSEVPATPGAPAGPPHAAVDAFFAKPLPEIRRALRAGLADYTDGRRQPRVNLEARAEGSYDPLQYDVRRYNALYSFGLNLWLDPTKPDEGRLSVTYQHGYSRGALTQSLDGLIVTLGFRF